MPARHLFLLPLAAAAFLSVTGSNCAPAAPFLIVGNDEKLLWDDKGAPIIYPAGKDSVVILDLAKPENPKVIATLPLKNSIVGPPVNLAIDPTNSIALVADSIDVTKDGEKLKMGPDNKVYVIDLKANPPKLADTIVVGKQPSGLSINSAGNLALVTNRIDKTVTLLSIKGTDVKVVDTVDLGGIVSHAVFTPDGKRALVTKFNDHKVSLLDVNGEKITYNKLDLPTGQWPYNVAVAPNGKIALTADNGGAGSSDGSVDTVSVVDLELNPPRIIDRVVVGDGPEGLAISPKGDVAVAVILAGTNSDKSAYFHKPNGTISVLRITGKKVTKVGDVPVGGLPEGVAFTPDGKYLYVGNYQDQDISILRVNGTQITPVKRFKLSGHPASIRMSTR
jgi:DNA-binding beta-propeller fold protein YncE